jgi:hypothetical protein
MIEVRVMTKKRHAFRPTLSGTVLEDRALPALVQVTPLTSIILASTNPFSQGPSAAVNTTSPAASANPGGGVRLGTNAGLGIGFTSRYSSAYATNAGLGQGYGIFYGGTTLMGGSPAQSPIGPSPLVFGTSLGASASLATGPGTGGGPASGGESGVSPGPDPSGPTPTQITPTPSSAPLPMTTPGPSSTIPAPSPSMPVTPAPASTPTIPMPPQSPLLSPLLGPSAAPASAPMATPAPFQGG